VHSSRRLIQITAPVIHEFRGSQIKVGNGVSYFIGESVFTMVKALKDFGEFKPMRKTNAFMLRANEDA